ncbi:MAG: hypothetical protein P8X95_19910 [Anaerolineales bacterium]|jgi:hypothetical protein
MKKSLVLLLAGIVLLGGVLLIPRAGAASAESSPKILDFDNMIGVPRPYTGGDNAIRGIPGGGLPWVIASGKGKLTGDGDLEIKVTGLVFDPSDPVVIERGLAGQNTIPAFRAIVSCLSKDENGDPTTINLTTDPFPATTGLGAGDAKIRAQLDLPSPCIAPIVFVTSPGGAWFAATGN